MAGAPPWYYPRGPVITPNIGNLSVFVLFGWRFVFGIVTNPHIVRCHHGSGINEAASRLRLRLNKASSTNE